MTKTATSARKFREDKKEIIKRLLATINAVRAANTPEALDALVAQNIAEAFMAQNIDGESDRATSLTAKLSDAVMDYVQSL